jgi:hypothetical protein
MTTKSLKTGIFGRIEIPLKPCSLGASLIHIRQPDLSALNTLMRSRSRQIVVDTFVTFAFGHQPRSQLR